MDQPNVVTKPREPWNKGKLVGQKAPFKLKEIWAIRIRLQLANCAPDLALFDLAIDSKLRACDLVRLRVRDVSHGDRVAARTIPGFALALFEASVAAVPPPSLLRSNPPGSIPIPFFQLQPLLETA